MIEQIELTDGFVTLIPYKLQYLDQLHESVIESMTELSVWMSWAHPDYPINESRE